MMKAADVCNDRKCADFAAYYRGIVSTNGLFHGQTPVSMIINVRIELTMPASLELGEPCLLVAKQQSTAIGTRSIASDAIVSR